MKIKPPLSVPKALSTGANMSDAWGGSSGYAAQFDPGVVKKLLGELERDIDALEKYYNAINVDTMQRREAHKANRQRAYDTSNRLRALLQLPAKNESEKEEILAKAQVILNRFADIQRRTVDIDGEIVAQMRKSLSSGTSNDIVLNNQIVLKSVDVSNEMLREYNEELAKAAEGVRELEAIAREMQAITQQQGTQLNSAEKQTRDADVEVIVGVDQQKKASKLACSNRMCCIIVICIITVIVLALALGIGLGVGLRKKKN